MIYLVLGRSGTSPADGQIILYANFVNNIQMGSNAQTLGIRPRLSVNRSRECCKNRSGRNKGNLLKGDEAMGNSKRRTVISGVITLAALTF